MLGQYKERMSNGNKEQIDDEKALEIITDGDSLNQAYKYDNLLSSHMEN